MSSSSDEDDVKLREALAPGFTIDASKARHLQLLHKPSSLRLNYKINFCFSTKITINTSRVKFRKQKVQAACREV